MVRRAKGQVPEHIRRHNLGLVLSIIRQRGGISRYELANITNLTKTSVSDIVSELLDYGMITEVGEGTASRRGGRRPIVLKIAPGSSVAVGVDIRRNIISALLLDLNGQILERKTASIRGGAPKNTVLKTLYRTVYQVIGQKGRKTRILGIGVGAPGPLDLGRGMILDLPDFRSLQNVSIKDSLSEKFGVPVFVQGGAMTGAVGEYFHRKSSGRSINDLVFVEIDLGLGLGFVFDDRVVHGPSSAGEIGHTVVETGGRMCSCGRRGCLYQYASGLAILKELRLVRTVRRSNIHILDEKVNYSELLRATIDLANSGDSRAVKAVAEAARYLSEGVLNVFNLLSPSLLVIGSSIPGLAELYWPTLKSRIDEARTLEKNISTRIELATFGPDAIAAGGAYAVLKAVYEDPRRMVGGNAS